MLKRKAKELSEEGEKLKEETKDAVIQDSWWARYKETRKVKTSYTKY